MITAERPAPSFIATEADPFLIGEHTVIEEIQTLRGNIFLRCLNNETEWKQAVAARSAEGLTPEEVAKIQKNINRLSREFLTLSRQYLALYRAQDLEEKRIEKLEKQSLVNGENESVEVAPSAEVGETWDESEVTLAWMQKVPNAVFIERLKLVKTGASVPFTYDSATARKELLKRRLPFKLLPR